MDKISTDTNRRPRFWFGGLCGCCACIALNPIDVIKVHLQTAIVKKSILRTIRDSYKQSGLAGYYSGLSAALFRQMTYTSARFALYETGKHFTNSESFNGKIRLAIISGFIAGYISVPSDVVLVRMQNDSKLPADKRRKYKNVLDGFQRIYKDEGIQALYKGSAYTVGRAVLMTVSVHATYDQVKLIIQPLTNMEDNVPLHLVTSSITGCITTFLTSPIDVITTKYQNANPNEFQSGWDAIRVTYQMGPQAFYKGVIPSLFRICPQTIIVFVLYEQMRLRYGWLPISS